MKRGRPPRQMSARREAQQERRAEVVEQVFVRDRGCRARSLVPDVACSGPLDAHEIIPRSAWRDGYLDATNIVAICRRHHAWVDLHPGLAREVGLHGMSWERPDAS